ncbi:MAG: DnaA/Hda family protein [Candidatus Thermoplasmatota archaeon]|nr:DnaA/Hda family protein [Candidatus Thermoplasmatota archaeon]
MILPKGTLDYTRKGGEGQIKEIISGITEGVCTGYLLVKGDLETDEGNRDNVIGQMVFKEGKPLLCESTVGTVVKKGDVGAFPLLSVMMEPEAEIELHSKIDVGPPYAFFKECRMEDELNLDEFIKLYKKHQDDLKKKKKERIEQEKRMKQMISDIEDWISEGYVIDDLDSKRQLGYKEMCDNYNDISARISRSREMVKWLDTVTTVDLQEQVKDLKERSKDISNMPEMEKAVKRIETALDQITEKRNEIIKWVKLWKEEGFNTESVEQKLDDDLDSAWNSMANFMDSIQQLKDYREELDAISKEKDAKGFSKNIAQIEFLLNDPNEIPAAGSSLASLKETMEAERAEKRKILEEAKTFEKGGFSIKRIEDSIDQRAKDLREMMELLKNNVARIKEIGATLDNTDRRDLTKDIDELKASMKDPFDLDRYESRLNDIQERILRIDQERDELRKKVDDIAGRGYEVVSIEPMFERPISELRGALEDLEKRVQRLSELSDELSGMDSRWLDGRFEELRAILIDPTQLDKAQDSMDRLKDDIGRREETREKVKNDLERWRSDGFIVKRVEEVIDDDLPAFSIVHDEMQKNITVCREMLKELSSINTRFFQGDADELRSLLQDPFEIDRARKNLADLVERVRSDTAIRIDLKKRLEELKKEGYRIDSLKDLIETPAPHIEDAIEDMETRISRLKEASSLIEKWDRVESSWLHPGIEELKKHLKDIGDHQGALEHFEDLKNLIESNHTKREKIRDRVKIWKDAGYNVRSLEKKLDASIEDLDAEFEETLKQIIKLEGFQERFDSLDLKHFKKEAEDIEFKLNDPGLVDEISLALEGLEAMIEEDRRKRSEIIKRIDDHISSGFQAAEKIKQYLDQDMSILELEMNNFEKEIQMFKKFMGSTGFRMPQETPKAEIEAKSEDGPSEEPSGADEGWEATGSMTFDNLIVGNSNRFAVKAAQGVADNPSKAYNPLFIYGNTGSGKTHLLSSIRTGILAKDSGISIGLLSIEELNSVLGGDDIEKNELNGYDVILLDDVHDIMSSTDEDILENMFGLMLNSNKQIVMTSSRPPGEITVISEKLRSRLESGLVVDIRPLSEDIKGPLLAELLKRRGLELEVSLRDRLLTSVNTDIVPMREIVETLIKASTENGGMNLDAVNSAIKQLSNLNPEEDEDLKGALERAMGSVKKVEGEGSTDGRTFLCEACGNAVEMNAATCPGCGASFESEIYQCPKCSIEVPVGSRTCPGCGAEFLVEEQ